MKERSWTVEEDSFLMEHWQYVICFHDVMKLANRLNRSVHEIRIRAYKLRKVKGKNWSAEEVDYLKTYWAFQSASEIGKIISRSEFGVQAKAETLKLKGGRKRSSLQNRKKNKASPNKPEIALDSLLQANFPGEYRFNGNYSQGVSLGGLIPDWVNVNGRKQVIELFGDYWHNKMKRIPWKSTEFGRKAVYSQLGFDCIIIWEHELEFPNEIVEKLREIKK